MRNLHIVHTSTNRAPDPDIERRLGPCDGDAAAWLRAECGVDTRKLYTAQHAYPVTFRRVTPEHGRYPASMYRPTRREHIVGWWETYRLAILRDALLAASFVIAVIVAAIVLNAFVDVLAALIARVLP